MLDGHVGWLSWLAASPVLGVLLVPALVRSVGPQPGPGPAGSRRAAVLAALAPSLVLFVVTLAGGGLVTFLPIERPDGVLATVGPAAVRRHRRGHPLARRHCSPTGWAAGCCCRWRWSSPPSGWCSPPSGSGPATAWVLVGAAVFGAGYGATQNLTLLAAFARAGEGGTTTASAMWNASFDAGTAIGALALGFLAAGIGLDWTYVVVAALLAAAVPLASAAARVAVRS